MMQFAIFALAAGTVAPLPPTESANPIIVEGQRDRSEQIRRFVRALTPAPIRGQLPRFRDEICPVVIGLSKHQDQLVGDRIRTIAAAAGVRVAKRDCDPNALLIVTKSKASTIRELSRTTPDFFPITWSDSQIERIAADPSPVAAWQLEVITGADGVDLGQASYSGGRQGDNPRAVLVQSIHGSSSRLRAMTTLRFGGTVVIVDGSALEGLSTTQLADYAAMRLLVRTEPGRYASLGEATILNVIDAPMGVEVPVTLTQWDMNFLKAFYRMPADAYVEAQRSDVGRTMERESN